MFLDDVIVNLLHRERGVAITEHGGFALISAFSQGQGELLDIQSKTVT